MKILQIAGKVVSSVGKIIVGGALIIGHAIMSVIGALICAITSQN